MPARVSAFTVLGLEPGADAAAIEAAYRRLIKLYHPDREGGDGVRAAEIIHAYRELRGGRALIDPLQFNDDPWSRRKRRRWPFAAAIALLAAGAGAFAIAMDVPRQLAGTLSGAKAGTIRQSARAALHPMDDPLHLHAIDSATAQAIHMYRTTDLMALGRVSRDCHRRFRERPGLELLDRCAAFDDAVVGLENRDPLRDGGPFAPLAVTGRQWSAASALSDDFLAMDGRLHKVRLRVELALAAAQPPPELPASGAAENKDR